MEENPDLNILDVRKKSEHFSEHVLDSENIALDYINEHIAEVNKDKTYYVHCAVGYRSMIFNSILKARGYDNLIDVQGGFDAIKASGKIQGERLRLSDHYVIITKKPVFKTYRLF